MLFAAPSSNLNAAQYAFTASQSAGLGPLDLVRLPPLMARTAGRPEITIALIDGPVATNHPDFAHTNIKELPGSSGGACTRADSLACQHGTLVAGVLSAARGSVAPAISPGCTLIVRPIFSETVSANGQIPSATPEELGTAINECVAAGANLINLSAALARSSPRGERWLSDSLEYCGRRGVIVVAAAGNQGTVGSSSITRHPCVIPVAAYDLQGRPIRYSNLGSSIGRQGLGAPGVNVSSLGSDGQPQVFGGTSAAAPFVTGTLALLFSEFPNAPAAQVKSAITAKGARRRQTIVPALLDAWAAYEHLGKI